MRMLSAVCRCCPRRSHYGSWSPGHTFESCHQIHHCCRRHESYNRHGIVEYVQALVRTTPTVDVTDVTGNILGAIMILATLVHKLTRVLQPTWRWKQDKVLCCRAFSRQVALVPLHSNTLHSPTRSN
jgi:hypothetical protein